MQNLDASLQHYSNEQLLEMFVWEFQRLPLIHNAPADDWDVDRVGLTDDSPLNVTLFNGAHFLHFIPKIPSIYT